MIKNLKKLSKIIEDIRNVEDEISNIEKIAEILANNPCRINLTLKVEDLKEKEKNDNKVEFDDDGSIVSQMNQQISFIDMIYGGAFKKQNHNKDEGYIKKCDALLNDVSSLKILSIIIKDKIEEREKLVKQLNKLKT